jgi:hypothetical protein
MSIIAAENLRSTIDNIVENTPITDIHTHLYTPCFGNLLLWGIDELLTYHYLVAETFRWKNLSYDEYWKMTKRQQADLIWKTLFIENSPISEATRGVLTVLDKLGLDTSTRDLAAYRAYFDSMTSAEYIDKVFKVANVDRLVMTNNPFDPEERPIWFDGYQADPRFMAALRIDNLLLDWPNAQKSLQEWGYTVTVELNDTTLAEVRRFLTEWLLRQDALYMAASLPPTFAMPDNSPCGILIEQAVLPVSRETNKPFAMMIGVKKLINPNLKLAGDGVGLSQIESVEYLCAKYPQNKFLVTMLQRENQHSLNVAARKFRNLMVFGCWWFLNIPSLIEEMTRMRLELLGTAVIPQHSDARVLDQLIYKWDHSRKIIANVLNDKYTDLMETGWQITEKELARDIKKLFSGNFYEFLEKEL